MLLKLSKLTTALCIPDKAPLPHTDSLGGVSTSFLTGLGPGPHCLENAPNALIPSQEHNRAGTAHREGEWTVIDGLTVIIELNWVHLLKRSKLSVEILQSKTYLEI